MHLCEFKKEIERLNEVIDRGMKEISNNFVEDGCEVERIQFEFVELDDIFQDLIKIIPLILSNYHYYVRLPFSKKIYKVFIAALCEITKRGFSKGGILKQVDEYIGFSFDRSKYYELIKIAFKSENIDILPQKSRKYEATLVYESGIPRKFHKSLNDLFKIYWKWMKGIDVDERKIFLRNFIEDKIINEVYIYDRTDFNRMKELKEEMNVFQEKVIKTCYQLDEIYTEIDKIEFRENRSNIDEVVETLNDRLRYNVKTIINVEELMNELINSSYKIGFRKFEYILNNLLPNTQIVLPTGKKIKKANYYYENFMCGIHKVGDVIYEVTYPFGLTCKDYTLLPRNKVIKRNEYYIYVSNDYFDVEVDGYSVNIRELVWKDDIVYIFVGKIPIASSAYIDGHLINTTQDVKIQASIRKFWDSDNRKNKLVLCLDDIKIFNKEYSMKTLEIKCNVVSKSIMRSINQKGHLRIREKLVEIENLDEGKITIIALIDDKEIARKEITIDEIYIYSIQLGMRIYKDVIWKEWQNDTRIIIFSKKEINKSNIEIEEQEKFLSMHVYLGSIDLQKQFIEINNNVIPIIYEKSPAIRILNNYSYIDDKIVVQPDSEIRFKCLNYENENLIIKIIHGEKRYKGISLSNFTKLENFTLKDCGVEDLIGCGRWTIILYKEQNKIFELSFYIAPKIEYQFVNNYYLENNDVKVRIFSNNDCFMNDGEMTNEIELKIGKARLLIDDNIVYADSIEFEVYDHVCHLPYSFVVKPEVWGIRLPNRELQKRGFDNYLELNYNNSVNPICLYSTSQISLKVNVKDNQFLENIDIGFNKIILDRLIDTNKRVNDVTFIDSYDYEYKVKVIINPQVIFDKLRNIDGNLSLSFSYSGPLDMNITIKIFLDEVFIKKYIEISKQTDYDFICNIGELKDIAGKDLLVEAKINNEDSFLIFSATIENNQLNKEINLNHYLRTLDLINRNNCCRELIFINKTSELLKTIKGLFA